MTDLFYGKFTVGGKEYEVIPEDYLEVPDDLEPEFIIKAAKQVAVKRMTIGNPDRLEDSPIRAKYDNFSDDGPVSRFTSTALIFDGNNLAHRCRHSFNLSYKGQDVSIIYGCLKVMQSVMRGYANVKCVVVCWDGGTPPHRTEASPEYKAHRTHDGDFDYENFLQQISILDNFLPDLGVLSLRNPGCEADDLIYAFTRLTGGDTLNVVISSDHDLYQCIDYHTVVNNPNLKEDVTVGNFEEVIGVKPSDYLIYRSMVGDSSDGLAGIRGIGHITAVKLLADYNSPSNLANIANGNGSLADYPPMSDKLAAKIKDFGLAGFAKMMKTMRLDIDLCGAKQHIWDEITWWESYNATAVLMFLKKYAFVSLMDPEFYGLFKALERPLSVVRSDAGRFTRFPKIKRSRAAVACLKED